MHTRARAHMHASIERHLVIVIPRKSEDFDLKTG